MKTCAHCINSVRVNDHTFFCGLYSDEPCFNRLKGACEDYEDMNEYLDQEPEDNSDEDWPEEDEE